MTTIGRPIPWLRAAKVAAKGSARHTNFYQYSLYRPNSAGRRYLSATFADSNVPQDNPVVLRHGTTVVHLLGTMHISESSAAATISLIKREHSAGKLGAIFLELDEERFKKLQFHDGNTTAMGPDDSLLSIWNSVGKLSPVALVEAVLRTIYRTLHHIGFASGVEFKAAIATYNRLENPAPDLILGDQHIRDTLKNVAKSAALDFAPHNLVRLLALKPTDLDLGMDRGNDVDMGKVIQEMMMGNSKAAQKMLDKFLDRKKARDLVKPLRKFAPNISRAIVDQRDDVMAQRLFKEATSAKYGGKSIVAVVGLAHIDGIVTRWDRLAKEEKENEQSET